MCCGVTSGLAFEKFSGSFIMSGLNDRIMNMEEIRMVSIRVSLKEW